MARVGPGAAARAGAGAPAGRPEAAAPAPAGRPEAGPRVARAGELAWGLARAGLHLARGEGAGARAELTALGPLAHKLGQALAARPDVVGPEWARMLEPLQVRYRRRRRPRQRPAPPRQRVGRARDG